MVEKVANLEEAYNRLVDAHNMYKAATGVEEDDTDAAYPNAIRQEKREVLSRCQEHLIRLK